MHTKKLYAIFGFAVILVGMAAFIGGRMFNGRTGIVSPIGSNSERVSVSLEDITPAPELPTTTPEITGIFVERKDNTIIISAFSFDPGVGGTSRDGPIDTNSGPKVEILITGGTTIYRESTEFNLPAAGENFSIQQTVEESTLDDLNEQTTVIVWGHRSGDRVIADVFFFSNPLMLKKPGSQ